MQLTSNIINLYKNYGIELISYGSLTLLNKLVENNILIKVCNGPSMRYEKNN